MRIEKFCKFNDGYVTLLRAPNIFIFWEMLIMVEEKHGELITMEVYPK